MLTYPCKLMNCTHTSDYSPVADHYMTCYLRVITDDTVIANHTIMSKMTISHDQAIFPYFCFVCFLSAAVDSYKFPDSCIITNKYIGVLTLEFQVLGYCSYYSTRKNPAIFTDPGSFHDGNI